MNKQNTTTIHAHHWRIDEPNGPTSKAVCKECGALRIYRNWLEETDFITNEDRAAMAPTAA